jgi:hypothetical protein
MVCLLVWLLGVIHDPGSFCRILGTQPRRQYRRDWQEFREAYRAASIAYRAGDLAVEFPDGSFRPPLVTMYSASAL